MCNQIGLPVRRRFSHFRDIQAFPEAAQAAALMCHPLLATNPSPARKTHGLLRAHSAPNLQQMSSTMEAMPLKGALSSISAILQHHGNCSIANRCLLI